MGHCQAALLADRAVFRVTGTDARKFLQGMLTNDIGKLSDGQAMHAGLLAPQGKILFELFVVAVEGRAGERYDLGVVHPGGRTTREVVAFPAEGGDARDGYLPRTLRFRP